MKCRAHDRSFGEQTHTNQNTTSYWCGSVRTKLKSIPGTTVRTPQQRKKGSRITPIWLYQKRTRGSIVWLRRYGCITKTKNLKLNQYRFFRRANTRKDSIKRVGFSIPALVARSCTRGGSVIPHNRKYPMQSLPVLSGVKTKTI